MNILLFTSEYPYGDYSEIFLTNELEIGSKYCKITILPLSKSKKLRVLPDNVVVNNACNNQPQSFYLFVFLKMLLSKYFWRSIFCKRFFEAKEISQKYFYLKNLFGAYIIKTIVRDRKVEYNYDTVFYSYWLTYAPLGLAMLKHEGFLKNKIISRAHSYEIDEHDVGFYFPLRNFTYAYLDYVFAISEIAANILLKRYPILTDKILIKRLGVLPIKDIVNPLEYELIKVVSCSGIRPEKRVELIFNSLNEFCKEYPNYKVKWTHIGASMGYENLKDQIKISTRNLTVNLLGSMENRDILDYYNWNNFNIFINLSTREGVPVAIMEAISSSIAVLATDVGATSEIVTNATGVLINKEFTQAEFNDGINFIIANYGDLSLSVYKHYMTYYNAEQNYNDFYQTLLKIF
jgi:glycosyltransferase involved in cell wall biosynthesis